MHGSKSGTRSIREKAVKNTHRMQHDKGICSRIDWVSADFVTEWETQHLYDTKSLIDITMLYDLEPVGLMEKLEKL